MAAPARSVTQCSGGGATATGDLIESVLNPAGPVGRAENVVLLDSLAIMLAIGVPTIVAALLFAWRYRATNTRAIYLPDWDYSGRIELVVWSIPTFVILFLGGVIWMGSHELDPAKPLSTRQPLEIQVISLDWKWLFIYPEQGIASVNQLVVPTGRPLHFTLTSASVMNVFFVPRLGSMIYTMNAVQTQLHLQADQPGEFLGESAMFSGDGFSDMRFVLRATPPSAFESWIASVRQQGARLDEPRYRQLLQPGIQSQPILFGTTQPGMFEAVLKQRLPPAPGPNNRESAPHGSSPGH
jgi:cytochrome o ubiquinol oxidase subunit 2